MMGYYKDEQKTAESFTEDGFLLTGDKGEIDEMGRLKITGRIKEIFKTSKGKYVAPAPIENKLTSSDALEVVCVSGADCPQPFALAVLAEQYIVRRDDPELKEQLVPELEELVKKVNATLDQHEQLQFLVVVKESWAIENEFLTPTMKIKRNVIEDFYSDRISSWQKQKKTVIWD